MNEQFYRLFVENYQGRRKQIDQEIDECLKQRKSACKGNGGN
ncbi:hypothetical protein PO124_34390 [Bacillus licheniformis]|nr:hypothetical protein [Bacillus licheniformis]